MVYKALKQTVRKYYKYWAQPILTENGTVGESTYATSTSNNTEDAYKAMTTDTTMSLSVPQADGMIQWWEFYSSEPIQVNSMSYELSYSGSFTGNDTITVTASLDGINWNTLAYNITSGNYTVSDIGKEIALPFTANIGLYKYYRLTNSTCFYRTASGTSYYSWYIQNVKFNNTATESTSSDYDYYVDTDTYKSYKVNNTYKALRS